MYLKLDLNLFYSYFWIVLLICEKLIELITQEYPISKIIGRENKHESDFGVRLSECLIFLLYLRKRGPFSTSVLTQGVKHVFSRIPRKSHLYLKRALVKNYKSKSISPLNSVYFFGTSVVSLVPVFAFHSKPKCFATMLINELLKIICFSTFCTRIEITCHDH